MKTLLFLMSAVLFINSPAWASILDDEPIQGEFSWGKESGGLALTISLTKEQAVSGESTELHVILKNVSDKELPIGEFSIFSGFEFIIQDSSKQVLPTTKDIVRKGAIYHKLAPSCGFKREYILSDICKLEKKGEYTIQVIYKLDPKQGDEKILKSNIVTLTVK